MEVVSIRFLIQQYTLCTKLLPTQLHVASIVIALIVNGGIPLRNHWQWFKIIQVTNSLTASGYSLVVYKW